MRIRCWNCGYYLDSEDTNCIKCGSENDTHIETIEDLKVYCANRHMPLERMRFFIDEDYKEPRAFGIYRTSEGKFVVYKNKADGSRAIRYAGPDEKYAVRELLARMEQEIENQENHGNISRTGSGSGASRGPAKKRSRWLSPNMIGIYYMCFIALIIIICLIVVMNQPKRGYYHYNDDTYYYLGGTWYIYDDGWSRTTVSDDFYDSYDDYYYGNDYGDYNDYYDYSVDDFEDTYYYSEWEESQSSSDSGSDYDYGGWDSGSTDWSSDW
ncbi:MAG: hypothetical protein K5848_04100 [Lachnospiraceae bacterium]|nr:hypothetical protein [Lachnospiraceae bacterium]